MGERREYTPGTFSWADLTTPDLDGATEFYAALFGWDHEDQPLPMGGVYRMYRQAGKDVAAASLPQQEGQPPAWLSYVTVADADASSSKTAELGGTVLAEPFDVMDAGRIALVQDPTGAVFALWQAGTNPGAGLVNGPGLLTMTQLNTADPDAASSFYTDLFGWRVEPMDDGSGQPYWSLHNGDIANAGMMPLPPEMGPSHWLVYFGHDNIDDAAVLIEKGGGQVLVPKMPVPGGSILVAQDAHGAVFALWEGSYDD